MKLLIVVATELEIGKLTNTLPSEVDILITGIGTPITIFQLSEQIHTKNYDLIINIGIAGAFSKKLKLGELVFVEEEFFGDLGFEDKENFIPITESQIIKKQTISFKNTYHSQFLEKLMSVKSISVNSCSGNSNTIKNRVSIFEPDIENMEGVGVFMVCSEKQIPFLEIRAISNYIEERNTKNWDIPLAINNLQKFIFDFIHYLTKK